MRFKNAFKILLSNSGVIFKAMFYRFITISLIALVSYFAVIPLLRPVFTCDEFKELWGVLIDAFGTLFKDFIHLKDTASSAEVFKNAFQNLLAHFKSSNETITQAALGVALFLFLANLLERVGNYAIAFLYNGYMSALTKFSIIATLLANIGKAFLYSIIVVPIALIIDAIVFVIAVLMIVFGVQFISIFAIFLATMFVIVALSFKLTLLSRFLPNIIVGKQSFGRAFVDTFSKRKHLSKLLGSYIFVLMISFYLNLSVALFTVGVGLFVSVPLCENMNIIIALVDYYNEHGKKYYTSSDSVVVPKHLNENAELLKYM